MKVLAGSFTLESNEHVPNPCVLEDFDIKFGQEAIDRMYVGDIFQEAGIELVPAIYANGENAGCLVREAFDYIERKFVETLREHIHELDGAFLFLHGASEVIGLEGGSGEHHILQEIRRLTGPYFPIAVVMDPHGNLSQAFADNVTILRCFRHSPHTDEAETYRIVAKLFVEFLNHRQNIHPVYRKLPLILGGEQSVSTDEPMLTINRYLDECERDERIRSCSFHIGYIRHDTHLAGCSVIVVPNRQEDTGYADKVADEIAAFIMERRHEFHYTGKTLPPGEALREAIEYAGKPVFITDSGDNVTSGAAGYNTVVLRQVLDRSDYNNKRILFAAIVDPHALSAMQKRDIGEEVTAEIGMETDELSKKVKVSAVLKKKGHMEGIRGDQSRRGDCVVLSVKEKPVDIIVCDKNLTYAEKHQYCAAGVSWEDYDIVVVKQGYLFPELKEAASMYVMSLTQGATYQKTDSIPFKRIMRPMYPIDKF